MLMTRFSRAVLLLALGAAIAFIGFHPLVLTDLIFGKGDAYHYFTPLWAARDVALRAGQLPLWTDNLFMGAPLLADSQLGTFYPPNWLTVGLPAWQALKISVFIHVAWAALGTYLLARRALDTGVIPAITGAAVFALGGYVGAHAEQINQLQGIAWMPWAFWCFQFVTDARPDHAGRSSVARGSFLTALLPLSLVLAFIALSGHTQTLFITGVALGIYALTFTVSHQVSESAAAQQDGLATRVSGVWLFFARRWRLTLRHLLILAAASILALVLAAVQILPTLELTGFSNRSGGFSSQAAMAFSWQPNLAARGVLPSLDGQVFGEYVAYLGVIGLALAIWGAIYGGGRRWPWLILALVGVIFAFGLYNPLYWMLAGLPGFNLFRVPARWLGLFALGGAMLSALGAQALVMRPVVRPRRVLFAILAFITVLAVLAVWRSPAAALEVDGDARPTLLTLIFWLGAALLFANAVLLREFIPRRALSLFLLVITLGELAIAAGNMPHRDLVDPMAASDPRQSAYHLLEAQNNGGAGRVLSISPAYFDTYDHEGLRERYSALGMTGRAVKAGLTAAKLKEILAPNFPLLYGVTSVDGFGGGLLPTVYYSAFTSLFLPDGALRTIDGRLREILARPECFGACVPDGRWLVLMGVEYLLLDKTYDRFYDGVQFDLGFQAHITGAHAITVAGFTADRLYVLAASADLQANFGEVPFSAPDNVLEADDGLLLLRFDLPQAARIEQVNFNTASGSGITVRAASLADSRTGAFEMLALDEWQKILSSDIKLYRAAPLPASVVAQTVVHVPDNWDGSEAALNLMRDPAFDPTSAVILHGAPEYLAGTNAGVGVVAVSRTDTRSEYAVTVAGDGDAVLLLNDAYFPGWIAAVDGEPVPLYRADVMFRAVVVPAGSHMLSIAYQPAWLTPLLVFGAAAWLIFGLVWAAVSRLRAEI